jgi:uncharacterized repeat protein (TIGR03803 family)
MWRTSRLASLIFVVPALLLTSLTTLAPAAHALSEKVVHSFAGADGEEPHASLIQGDDGNFYGTTFEGGANDGGTVFKLTPSGTLTTLYSFCSVVSGTGACLDGESPLGSLIQGDDGNFYGTTSGGGANDYYGTVFKLTPDGTLTTLYSFCSLVSDTGVCLDGDAPQFGLIQGSDGNFYGTTGGGGSGGHESSEDGTVFKITPAGALTTLYSFCSVLDSTGNCSDGEYPRGGVILGDDGNLYGTTYWSGAHGRGMVFKLTPDGTLTTLYSFCNGYDESRNSCTDGQWPVGGVIQGSDGNFYGTTYWGGADNVGTVFKLTPSGTLVTLHSFGRRPGDGLYPEAGLIQGTDGNFYGTTYAGGAKPNQVNAGPGTVFKIAPSGKLTTLYNFCRKGQPAFGNCISGENPEAVLIQGSHGDFYGTTVSGGANGLGTVFEVGPHRVRRDTSR